MSIFPTKVLLATDGSEEASSATEAAVEIAQKTGSELHVVHVYGIVPIYPLYPEATDPGRAELEDPVLEEELEGLSERRAQEVLDAAVEKVQSAGATVAQAHLREGGVPHEIVALAEDLEVGLVVVGSRGRGGIRRALMGSVSDAVVRHAHCPVLVVRRQESATQSRLVLHRLSRVQSVARPQSSHMLPSPLYHRLRRTRSVARYAGTRARVEASATLEQAEELGRVLVELGERVERLTQDTPAWYAATRARARVGARATLEQAQELMRVLEGVGRAVG